MPILVRPVREQLEHDRIIRLLQARYQKKHDPVANIGHEPPTSIVIGTSEFVPDLILVTHDKARKLEGVVEVETGESVHLLEARAEWGVFSKLKAAFHLYVPPQVLDAARRFGIPLDGDRLFPSVEAAVRALERDPPRSDGARDLL